MKKSEIVKMLANNAHKVLGDSVIRDTMNLYSGYKIIKASDGSEIIDCRVYQTKCKGSSGYQYACALWINSKDYYVTVFSGKTRGYGYSKPTHSVEKALQKLGIYLDLFNAESSLMEIANAIYSGKKYLVDFYG